MTGGRVNAVRTAPSPLGDRGKGSSRRKDTMANRLRSACMRGRNDAADLPRQNTALGHAAHSSLSRRAAAARTVHPAVCGCGVSRADMAGAGLPGHSATSLGAAFPGRTARVVATVRRCPSGGAVAPVGTMLPGRPWRARAETGAAPRVPGRLGARRGASAATRLRETAPSRDLAAVASVVRLNHWVGQIGRKVP
jgi:hypothetical protein